MEGKLRKAFKRRERKIRLAWTQADTKESLPSKDCSSLTVKRSRDNHKCNSSDNSRSRDSGTRYVKSLVLTRIPKQTISKAGVNLFQAKRQSLGYRLQSSKGIVSQRRTFSAVEIIYVNISGKSGFRENIYDGIGNYQESLNVIIAQIWKFYIAHSV